MAFRELEHDAAGDPIAIRCCSVEIPVRVHSDPLRVAEARRLFGKRIENGLGRSGRIQLVDGALSISAGATAVLARPVQKAG